MLLYNTFKEYARIQEEVSVTDEGIFIKGRTPDSYGGPVLNMWMVHMVHMVDAGGNFQTLEFHNDEPLNKDKSSKLGVIKLDGVVPVSPHLGSRVANGGDERTWVTKKSTILPERYKTKGDTTWALRVSDAAISGSSGT